METKPKIGFFPRLWLDGRVVSGAGEVIYNDKVLLKPGFSPRPLNDITIAALGTALGHKGDHVYAFGLNGKNIRRIIESPLNNNWGAGADQFSPAAAGEIAVEYDQVTGVRGSIREFGNDNNDRQIVIDGLIRTPRKAFGGQAVLNLRLFGGMAVWRQWSGKDSADSGISGIRDYAGGSPVVNLRSLANEWEGSPVPFRINGEDWFAFATDTDIRLRPWDSFMGYIVDTGQNRNLNLDAMGLGVLARLVYHDDSGVGELRDIDTRNPRTDVRVRAGSVPPPPPPPKEPPTVKMPNIFPTVERVRAKYPKRVTPAQAVAMLNEIALQHEGFGLLAKTGGNRARQPITGIECSVDWLTYLPTLEGFDCFGSGPNSTVDPTHPDYTNVAKPQWDETPSTIERERFVPPVTVPGNDVPDDDLPPDASLVIVDTSKLEAILVSIAEEVIELREKVAELERRPSGGNVLQFPLRVSLKAHTGKFIVVEEGSTEVKADRDAAGPWETFDLNIAA